MDASTSKTEAMIAYQYLLGRLMPKYSITSEELACQLDDAIYVLQAEMDFIKVFEAIELAWNWGCAIRNETATNMDTEETKERVSDAGWYLDEIYWEMNSAFVAISERRNLAEKITYGIKEIREKILEDAAKRIAKKAHESYRDTIKVLRYWLNPDIAVIPGSFTDNILKARAEVHRNEPLWDIGTALTSKKPYVREIFKYRYMLSFGEHFAKHYKSLQK